jgi:hypothetical protein
MSTLHPNAQLITDFYTAFNKQDAGPMRAAYTADAQFSDPAFPELRGAAVGDMWTMLCEQAKEFRLEFRDVKADDSSGSAHWEAWYRFGGKRPVHNVIDATFTFTGGKISRHVDSFDFWRWSRQALGPAGVLLGWTPMLRKAVNGRAAAGLAAWQKRKA